MSDDAPVSAAALRGFVSRALAAQGVPEQDADTVAGLMVEADIFGYGTHGVFRLRQYLARLKGGGCNPKAQVKIAHETLATGLIDGDNGLGHLAMTAARDLAIEKARTAGIGWVGVRRGNHAGPLALYLRPQAEAGLIGMAAAVGSLAFPTAVAFLVYAIIIVPLKRCARPFVPSWWICLPQPAQAASSAATAFPHSGQNAMYRQLRCPTSDPTRPDQCSRVER